MKPIGIGILGCGNISGVYLENLTNLFDNTAVKVVYDLCMERSRLQAEKYHIPCAASLKEFLQNDEVEIVVNLTPASVHASLTRECLQHDKHVYSEKPLGLHAQEAQELCDLAMRRGLLLCAAPDTFLGAGYQTARELVDSGAIGRITSAGAFALYSGPESWHPDPREFFREGGGPMFGRGPYHLTALISLLGPADGVFGMNGRAHLTRTITSHPLYCQEMKVEIPTHVCGLIHFQNGCICTIIESYDAHQTTLPHMEIQGTEGTLLLPDPNNFGGEIHICRKGEKEFHPAALTYPYFQNCRGLGVSDMADCMRTGAIPRTQAQLAAHVVEIMEMLHVSWHEKRYIPLRTTCTQPPPRSR